MSIWSTTGAISLNRSRAVHRLPTTGTNEGSSGINAIQLSDMLSLSASAQYKPLSGVVASGKQNNQDTYRIGIDDVM